MEHTLNSLIKFSSHDYETPKRKRLHSFHYDHSGHVVATNSHVLFATKKPWEIEKAGKTFLRDDYTNGYFTEAEEKFPEWKEVIPLESGRRITIKIPDWFETFGDENRDATMVLDYTDTSKPFFKISDIIGETCLGFNIKYLSCFAGEEITILITSPISPAIVVSKDSNLDPLSSFFKEEVLKEDWFYVLMPIRLDEDLSDEVYI